MRARVPRYLHLPVQVLWFDMEDIGLILVMYTLYLVLDSMYVLPFVVLVPYLFRSVKQSKPRGWLRHVLYRYGFVSLKGYPPPATRSYRE